LHCLQDEKVAGIPMITSQLEEMELEAASIPMEQMTTIGDNGDGGALTASQDLPPPNGINNGNGIAVRGNGAIEGLQQQGEVIHV
jgi:hypothetical protein